MSNVKTGQSKLLRWLGDDEPEPIEFLVEKLLPKSGVAILAGPSQAGKTFAAADIAVAVMTGGQIGSHRVLHSGGVLWLPAEGENSIEYRMAASLEDKHGISGIGLRKLPWARPVGGVPTLTDEDALDQLIALAEEAKQRMIEMDCGLVLIVVDTFAAAASLPDGDKSGPTQAVMNLLRDFSREANALVLAIDHFGKSKERGIIGSSMKTANADATLFVLADIRQGRVSNRHMITGKDREGPSGSVIPFVLRVVKDGTTCVVDWGDERATVAGKKEAPKSVALFADAVRAALAKSGIEENGRRVAPGEAVRTAFLEMYKKVKPGRGSNVYRAAFSNSRSAALVSGIVVRRESDGETRPDVFWINEIDDAKRTVAPHVVSHTSCAENVRAPGASTLRTARTAQSRANRAVRAPAEATAKSGSARRVTLDFTGVMRPEAD